MARRKTPDLLLFFLCGILLIAGILILASVSFSFSIQKTGNSLYFLNHQLLFGLLPGLLAGTAVFFTPLSLFKKFSFVLLLINIALLALVFVPGIGENLGGAHRWIFIGPFSFQPSEILKVTFILYVASWLAGHAAKKESFTQTLLPFAAAMGVISLFLILQPDVGTLGIIAATGLAMYFLSGTPLWHTATLMGFGFSALALLVLMAPYRLNRLLVFLDPSFDPLGKGYQAKQALIGIGSGGLFGAGLGLSFQKFGVLPEPMSDSIFAIFAEETGFIGSIFLIMLFAAFAWRVLVISRRTSDRFASLTAAGIGFWIFLQASVNMGAMLGLVPLTGIPLPFISYGGSALFSELIAMGILLNISKYA